MRRTDTSGLTQPGDWARAMRRGGHAGPGLAPRLLLLRLRLGAGRRRPRLRDGLLRARDRGLAHAAARDTSPIYRVPPDLVRCTKPDGTSGRGRIDPTGACTLYFTRAEIEDGALAGKGLELAWAEDPVDLFFLEIQGSGRIHLPDGSVMRIGYAGQNGRDYVAIGRLLRDRGILPPGGASMQAIKDWIRANPDQGRALMRENLSYIFFKELTGPGPLGALDVPVTPRGDGRRRPELRAARGADLPPQGRSATKSTGLWVAQDIGGAIKGPNRFDTFWGAGPRRSRSPAECRRRARR